MSNIRVQIRSFIWAAFGALMLVSSGMANAGSPALKSEASASPHAMHETAATSFHGSPHSGDHALPDGDGGCIDHGGDSGACCTHGCVDFSVLTYDLSQRLFDPASKAGIEDHGLLSHISPSFYRPPSA